MDNERESYDPCDADVFSRGSLKLTFDSIRKVNPALALQVRNITSGTPLPKQAAQNDSEHADYFRVSLDSFQVRAVVEALMEIQQTEKDNPGMELMSKALTDDWVALARKMFEEMPKE